MSTLARTSWLSLALQRLPRPVLAMLDGWSSRLALRRRERRRRVLRLARVAAPVYRLKPWRD